MTEPFRTFPDFWDSEVTGHYRVLMEEQGVSKRTLREYTEMTWREAIKAYKQHEADGILNSRIENEEGERD